MDGFDFEPSRHFIMVNGKIKPATLEEWANWFDDIDQRRVDWTDISNEPNYPGGEHISTVCLGLDHGFNFDEFLKHKPILFETMVFGGKYDQRMWRYSTYGEAKRGHWHIVDCIKAGKPPDVNFGERPFIDIFFEGMKGMFDDEPEKSAGDEGTPK